MVNNLPVMNNNGNLAEEEFLEEYVLYDTEEDREKEDGYHAFLEVVKEMINGSCRAVVLDEEVIFNTYGEMTYRESILEYIIREKIAEEPHRHLICPLFRKNKDFSLEIYCCDWKLLVQYDHVEKVFKLSKKIE